MSEITTNSIPTENTSICEHCGMKVKADAQFCSACGKPVIPKSVRIFCQTCGAELTQDEMFCPKCGSSTSQNKNAEALNNIAAYNASLDTAITQKPKKKKVWKVLLIILGVLTALAIVGYFVILPEYNYQEACSALKRGSYSYAISCFEDLGDYKDSQTKILEAKYRYVLDNKDNQNQTTFIYLKELKRDYYKDSSEIYDDLYEWKVTGVCNRDPDNWTKHESSISKYSKYIHFSFTLEGGTPGESIDLTHTAIMPNGRVNESDWHWENEYDGSSFGCEYDTGLYEYPEYGATGTLTLKVYNLKTGEYLGSVSTRITN